MDQMAEAQKKAAETVSSFGVRLTPRLKARCEMKLRRQVTYYLLVTGSGKMISSYVLLP
jgi:hypothetical protein